MARVGVKERARGRGKDERREPSGEEGGGGGGGGGEEALILCGYFSGMSSLKMYE